MHFRDMLKGAGGEFEEPMAAGNKQQQAED